ncbi:unnamed protein product [Agarophyton chilense]
MSDVDITAEGTQRLLAFATDVARQAGTIIKAAFDQPCHHNYGRKSQTDPVTETDHAVEAFIFGKIRARFNQHCFIGEESASDTEWTDEPTWIVDPIDGTANFVHRIPMCAVSIAFTLNKQYIIGVIYNPLLNELFSATHHTSATLNNRPIKVSTVSKLSSACISTEAGSDRSKEKTNWILQNLSVMLKNNAQCVRMLGSCALNMANLACGRIDLLYERGPWPWDMAAGVLIIRQAGGVVLSGDLASASDFELTGRCILAFTPCLKPELFDKLL